VGVQLRPQGRDEPGERRVVAGAREREVGVRDTRGVVPRRKLGHER